MLGLDSASFNGLTIMTCAASHVVWVVVPGKNIDVACNIKLGFVVRWVNATWRLASQNTGQVSLSWRTGGLVPSGAVPLLNARS